MNNARELFREAELLGAKLEIRGAKLHVAAPEPLPDAFVQELRLRKAEIIAFIAAERQEMDCSEDEALLAWACALAEQDLVLHEPVEFIEAPLTTVTTDQVSRCATRYLRTISSARTMVEVGTWGQWSAEWWRNRELDAFVALRGLRGALQGGRISPIIEPVDEARRKRS